MSDRAVTYVTLALCALMLIVICLLLIFLPPWARPVSAGATFADVPADHWANPWVEQAYAEGLTAGCGTNAEGQPIFCPDRVPTRAEWIVWLLKIEHGYDYQPGG